MAISEINVTLIHNFIIIVKYESTYSQTLPQKGKGNVPDMIATFTYMHRYLAHDYSASCALRDKHRIKICCAFCVY
jgi:hypothetical protein